MQLPHTDHGNTLFEIAREFIFQTNQSVFLTGKAGTGKTTFLRYVKEHCFKQLAVVAPTGVAAINAGGVTIHSLFQLPFASFLPQQPDIEPSNSSMQVYTPQVLLARLRYTAERRNLLRSIDLLIIDEISMVRCDVLDAIDIILRYVRRNDAPFGGVQLLMIGDLYQLPPVIKGEEWQVLQEYYKGPFFFHSQVLQRQQPVCVELTTIYRQRQQQFVALLNEIRNNKLTPQGLELLHTRYLPDFEPPQEEHYITLTTHNNAADSINADRLEALQEEVKIFEAEVEGDFSSRNYPAEETLRLKKGAQVMFIKNDPSPDKKFYNGKIGVITSFEENAIEVQCKGDTGPVVVKPLKWEQMQYQLNVQTKEVEETVTGTFTQYPLRLAWAVTIHKCQGLTFDKAIIDAGRAFSAGQVYVALSRCTSLEGVVLRSKILSSAVFTDHRVVAFASTQPKEDALYDFLSSARRKFQEQLLIESFNSASITNALSAMTHFLQAHTEDFLPFWGEWLDPLQQAAAEMKQTADKFIKQLQLLFSDTIVPSENEPLQQRVSKAAAWFTDHIDSKLLSCIKHDLPQTDSKEVALSFEELYGELLKTVMQWKKVLTSCLPGFSTEEVLKARSKATIESIAGVGYSGSRQASGPLPESDHPALMQQLRHLRNELCTSSGKPVYMVANTKALQEMCRLLPVTEDALLQVKGFGPVKVKQYGPQFLGIIADYIEANGIVPPTARASRLSAKESKASKPPKIPTHEVSLSMCQEGKAVPEIARERGLKESTIEGHLAPYVLQGIVPMKALVPDALFDRISRAVLKHKPGSVLAARQQAGGEASYQQVQTVMLWMRQEGLLDEFDNERI